MQKIIFGLLGVCGSLILCIRLKVFIAKIVLEKKEKEAKLLPKKFIFLGSSLASSAPPLVEIICYSFLSNHYHFLLKQLQEKGIEKFMHKLGYGYSRYFNHKYNRSGSLFQGTYKAKHIDKDSYLLWISGYINGNPEIHKIAKAEDWPWSSYRDYLGKRNGTLCNKNIILKDFKNISEYKHLVNHIIRGSSQKKDDIKKYLLE